jgi:1-acyl-sn-glycerol-3-phosphate acyltransferase
VKVLGFELTPWVDLPWMVNFESVADPLWIKTSIMLVRGVLGSVPSFRLVREGFSIDKFDRPVIVVTNHTNYYDWLPTRFCLYDALGVQLSSWIKPRPFNSGYPVQVFLSKTGNIPLASRGYILVADYNELFGEPPDAETYRALRDHIDTGEDLPDDPKFQKILNTPRRMLGWSFDPRMLPYREALQRTFAEMMDASLRLARRASRANQFMHVYPEGIISSRLIPGKIGTMQLALELGADILPIGVSGAREAFVNGPRPEPNTTVHVRVGEPWRVPRHEYPSDFRAFGASIPDDIREQLQTHTDEYMEKLNDLLEPEYRWMPDGQSDGWQGIDRFIPTDKG